MQNLYIICLRILRLSRYIIRRVLYWLSKRIIRIFFVLLFVVAGSANLKAYQVEMWQLQAYTYFESSNLYRFDGGNKGITLTLDWSSTPLTNGKVINHGSAYSPVSGGVNRFFPYPVIRFVGRGGGNEYKKSFSSVVVNGRQSHFIFSFLVKSSYFPQNNVTFWDSDDKPYKAEGSTYFAVGHYFRYTYRLKVTSSSKFIYLYDSKEDLFNKDIVPLYVGWQDDMTADARAITGLNSSNENGGISNISDLQHKTNYELQQLYHLIQSDNSRTDKRLVEIQNSGKEISNSKSSKDMTKSGSDLKERSSTIDNSTKKGYDEVRKIKINPLDIFINYASLASRLTVVYNYIFMIHPLYIAVATIFVYIIVRMTQRG